MSKLLFLWVIFGLLLSSCSNQQPATPTPSLMPTERPVQVISGIPYVTEGNPLQVLDIYLPKGGSQAFPSLMILHGSGSDKSDWSVTADDLANEGYAVVAINYREAPQFPYRASIQDAFCALAWLHANSSRYGLDPQRVVVMGYSLGGTLASLIGTVDDPALFMEDCPHSLPEKNWVSGIISAAGMLDLIQAAASSTATHDLLVQVLGAEPQEAPETWAQSSPIEWVEGSEPPFLIVQGLKDEKVNPEQARSVAARLQQAGIEVDLVLIPEAFHGTLLASPEYQQAVNTFLKTLW